MTTAGIDDLVKRLREGRIESIEECFVTEVGATTQLQLDAADAIIAMSARIAELEGAVDFFLESNATLPEGRHSVEAIQKWFYTMKEPFARLKAARSSAATPSVGEDVEKVARAIYKADVSPERPKKWEDLDEGWTDKSMRVFYLSLARAAIAALGRT